MSRIAMVTGANSGVGFETAIGLAKAGLSVVMACRNGVKAEAAKKAIAQRLPSAELEVMELDLSRAASVRAFAATFLERHDHLNVLVNNAGVLDYSGRKNDAGIELQLATNHLGHFLLTSLLIDRMPDESSSRVVSLSSIAHKQGMIALEDINCEHQTDKGFAYAQSKLACLMFSSELQRRLELAGRNLLSVCAHPGGTDSGLFDDMSRLQYYALKLVGPLITHSNDNAAKPSLHAALSTEVRGGDYFGPQGFKDLKGPVGHAARTKYSEDADVAAKLWALSEELLDEPFADLN
jgi:NAD(P)-dependent dehydrogenase (short-subunit alcohol dehydrogenase family)